MKNETNSIIMAVLSGEGCRSDWISICKPVFFQQTIPSYSFFQCVGAEKVISGSGSRSGSDFSDNSGSGSGFGSGSGSGFGSIPGSGSK